MTIARMIQAAICPILRREGVESPYGNPAICGRCPWVVCFYSGDVRQFIQAHGEPLPNNAWWAQNKDFISGNHQDADWKIQLRDGRLCDLRVPDDRIGEKISTFVELADELGIDVDSLVKNKYGKKN